MPPKLRVTKLRRGIFFVGVIVLLTTLLFECVLRVFDPLGLSYFADGNRYFAELLVPSEGYGYIHRPNVEVSLRTMEITTKGQGFRWKEFPKTPSSNGTQVVILGDSIVMGWGLPIEQTFSTKLEQSNSSIHVLSAGVASWNTRTEYEWFKRVGVDYNRTWWFGWSPQMT